MSGSPTDTLRYALDPRSVAIVGASENPDKIGGRVYARTVVHRAPSESLRSHAPCLIVMVDADEGFRLMAHGDPGLVIGDRVRARFIDFDGGLIPRFEKADQ